MGYTTEQFITKAKKVHGDKYSYELVDYVNAKTKVKIVCQKHGVFEQKPNNHLSGAGCPECGGNISPTTEQFIARVNKVHGDKYSYELVDYKNNRTKVKIVCSEHGVFEQKPNNHLSGAGCPKCADIENGDNKKLTTEQFIARVNKVHGNKYSYELVDYVNAHTRIKIICQKHGIFEQKSYHHIRGHGCPKCAKIISQQEIEFTNYIRSLYDGTVITNSRGVIPPYELDVYLPDLNIAMEYNGMYWHNEGVMKPIGYHQMKIDRCKELSIELYHIWEDDWMNNREECKEMVRGIII